MSKDKHTNRGNVNISVYCVYMVLLRPCKHSTLFHLKPAFKNGRHHSDSLKSAPLSLHCQWQCWLALSRPPCHWLAWARSTCSRESSLPAGGPRSHPQTASVRLAQRGALTWRLLAEWRGANSSEECRGHRSAPSGLAARMHQAQARPPEEVPLATGLFHHKSVPTRAPSH